jgi:hypothetical protein
VNPYVPRAARVPFARRTDGTLAYGVEEVVAEPRRASVKASGPRPRAACATAPRMILPVRLEVGSARAARRYGRRKGADESPSWLSSGAALPVRTPSTGSRRGAPREVRPSVFCDCRNRQFPAVDYKPPEFAVVLYSLFTAITSRRSSSSRISTALTYRPLSTGIPLCSSDRIAFNTGPFELPCAKELLTATFGCAIK